VGTTVGAADGPLAGTLVGGLVMVTFSSTPGVGTAVYCTNVGPGGLVKVTLVSELGGAVTFGSGTGASAGGLVRVTFSSNDGTFVAVGSEAGGLVGPLVRLASFFDVGTGDNSMLNSTGGLV